MRHARKRSSQLFGDLRETLGKPLYMELVNNGIIIRHLRRLIVFPIEMMIDHDGLGRNRRIIPVVEREIVLADGIAEQCIVPFTYRANTFCIRIEQDLGRVKTMPVLRFIWTVDAISIECAGFEIGDIAMPDVMGPFGELDLGG